MTKAMNTHSEYVMLLFHTNSGYTNVSQCYMYIHYLSC